MADATVGLLVDVSGSMRASILNDSPGLMSRLDGWVDALRRAADRAQAGVRETSGPEASEVRVFAIAFGLQDAAGPVCDLLSLLELAGQAGGATPSEGGSASDRRSDPYDELNRIALQQGKEGWIRWTRHNLSPEEASTLVGNLHRSPALLGALSRSLPNMSDAEMRVAENRNKRRQAQTPGTTLKLHWRASRPGFQAGLDEAERMVRDLSSRQVTFAEVVADNLARMGRTELTVAEFADLLRAQATSGFVGAGLDEVLFGGTPMRAALETAAGRFKNHRANRAMADAPFTDVLKRVQSDSSATLGRTLLGWAARFADLSWSNFHNREYARPADTLFVVSDGQSTDGDPASNFTALRDAGVTVVCCYVADQDHTPDPRHLLTVAPASWDAATRTMFDGASIVPDGPYLGYLREKGWQVPDGAKLFFQVNHSAVLAEIAEMVLT